MATFDEDIRWGATVLLFALTACATVDLRPEPFDPDTAPEARAWLARAVEASGGDAWRTANTARFVFTDRWPSWLYRTFGRPWPAERMQLDTKLGTEDGRVTFLDGDDAGAGWGLQHWVSYRFRGDAVEVDEDRDDVIAFWIPTTLYFPQANARLAEADVVAFVGTKTIAGREHAGVFLTWGRAEPQDDVDQYVAWIDTKTHLIGWLEYTVRDYGDWLRGTMRYRDYREVGGLTIPHRLTVVPELGEEEEMGLHEYVIESVEVGLDWPRAYLYPAPDRSGRK